MPSQPSIEVVSFEAKIENDARPDNESPPEPQRSTHGRVDWCHAWAIARQIRRRNYFHFNVRHSGRRDPDCATPPKTVADSNNSRGPLKVEAYEPMESQQRIDSP